MTLVNSRISMTGDPTSAGDQIQHIWSDSSDLPGISEGSADSDDGVRNNSHAKVVADTVIEAGASALGDLRGNDRCGQHRVTLEELVNGGRGGATLGDGPDDQRLAASGVAGRGFGQGGVYR